VNTADLVFEGGIKTFTLTVSEAGKDPKTVTVSLNVVANTTGAALFLVSRQGGVETLTRKDTGPIENGPADTTAPAAFTGLYDALVWVDKNTATEQEWLIRVEAAETQIPRMVLACRTDTTNHASNVTIRLRGMGTGERIIKHDESSTAYKGRGITNTVLSNSWGFISLRGMSRDESTPGITFQLEKNITLKGTVDHLADSNNHYRFMFLVHEKSVLKLMAGSKITGYYTGGTSGGIDFSMIELGDKNNRWSSQYRLVIEAGAEISGNSFVTDPDATDQSGHARLVHVLIGGTNPYYPPPSSPIISIASGAVITNNGSELTNCVTFGTALNTMHNYPLSAGTAYILPIPEHLGQ
jgi:hypothetical protein